MIFVTEEQTLGEVMKADFPRFTWSFEGFQTQWFIITKGNTLYGLSLKAGPTEVIGNHGETTIFVRIMVFLLSKLPTNGMIWPALREL